MTKLTLDDVQQYAKILQVKLEKVDASEKELKKLAKKIETREDNLCDGFIDPVVFHKRDNYTKKETKLWYARDIVTDKFLGFIMFADRFVQERHGGIVVKSKTLKSQKADVSIVLDLCATRKGIGALLLLLSFVEAGKDGVVLFVAQKIQESKKKKRGQSRFTKAKKKEVWINSEGAVKLYTKFHFQFDSNKWEDSDGTPMIGPDFYYLKKVPTKEQVEEIMKTTIKFAITGKWRDTSRQALHQSRMTAIRSRAASLQRKKREASQEKFRQLVKKGLSRERMAAIRSRAASLQREKERERLKRETSREKFRQLAKKGLSRERMAAIRNRAASLQRERERLKREASREKFRQLAKKGLSRERMAAIRSRAASLQREKQQLEQERKYDDTSPIHEVERKYDDTSPVHEVERKYDDTSPVHEVKLPSNNNRRREQRRPSRNNSSRNSSRLYCGNKENAPLNSVKGTLFDCFKKGVGVGMNLGGGGQRSRSRSPS